VFYADYCLPSSCGGFCFSLLLQTF
jgi:hypothetical protein